MVGTMIEVVEKDIFRIISSTAEALGVRVYVVGQYVRDFIVRRPCNSIDIVVEGNAIDFAHSLGEKVPSRFSFFKNFGTAIFKYHGDSIQLLSDRRLLTPGKEQKPFYGKNALEDYQYRTDFSINTIAVSLNNNDYGKLFDPYDGIGSLSKGKICTTTPADASIQGDPIRMIRAIRLVAQLSTPLLLFRIAPDLLNTIKKNSHLIESATKERVVDELNKILLSDAPGSAVSLLEETGILSIIIRPLSATKGVEKRNGKGYEDSFPHTLKVLNNVAELEHSSSSDITNSLGIKQGEPNLWLRWAALLHDIGKPATKRFDPEKGWSFYGYDVIGARMVPQVFSSLKMPLNDTMKYVQKLISLQCRPKTLLEKGTTESAYRRLLVDAGDDIEDLMLLCMANITSVNKTKAEKELSDMESVTRKLLEVKTRDAVRNLKSPISANYIMDLYGLEPCNTLGMLKEYIRQAIINGEIQNTFEEADVLLRKKASEMGLICLKTDRL